MAAAALYFYPRPPRGGRRRNAGCAAAITNFYPRPPRGGRRGCRGSHEPDLCISIHALREEGDQGLFFGAVHGIISIHALREEGDRSVSGRRIRGSHFYPRPPRGGRLACLVFGKNWQNFYPRPPRGGRQQRAHAAGTAQHFYPRPPRGGRRDASQPPKSPAIFLSTPSARRATPCYGDRSNYHPYFYPRPPRGGRPMVSPTEATLSAFLSTPSARRATDLEIVAHLGGGISIHALREEGDTHTKDRKARCKAFLSTPSARRATSAYVTSWLSFLNFYPRPPRGGRPDNYSTVPTLSQISIHALREEGDINGLSEIRRRYEISIHALREEGDRHSPFHKLVTQYFYPRPPRGGRPLQTAETYWQRDISIHALREEGDTRPVLLPAPVSIFLSTPSARRATHRSGGSGKPGSYFYPRPPRGGRPLCTPQPGFPSLISIHALREEGDL